ncbi:MAG TPA: hypothetical protein VMZ53_32810 [Kofleriaceae bacterium]|nr:hypothetical protein [Kofleriaceae bacterium]
MSVPHVLDTLPTQIVQTAPAIDPKHIAAVRYELEYIGSPLALTISRIYELVGEGLVDPAIALPALAEACATLVAGMRGEVGESVLEAARYQIDTLTPMPDKPPRVAAPDVPLTSLKRRS